MRRLVACLLGGLLCASPAASAWAESWQPVAGESGTYYDKDFVRKDPDSGMILLRFAQGKPGPGGGSWDAAKAPIMMYAVDCAGDAWIDLGLDFNGKAAAPKGWRTRAKETDIKAGVGKAASLVCSQAAPPAAATASQ